MVVNLDDNPKTQLIKGIFPGALVRRGEDWKYEDEVSLHYSSSFHDRIAICFCFYFCSFSFQDGGSRSVGKVVPSPNGRHGGTPGKVWVQWPHEKNKSYSYRVGFNGQMDLKIAKAGVGGRYQPHTLPILKISKPKLDEKKNDVAVALPLVLGDKVKFAVGLEELREIVVDCGLEWNPTDMKKVMKLKMICHVAMRVTCIV